MQRHSTEKLAAGVMALATAHKSKGLEFGSVELAEDFYEHELLHGPAEELVEWEYDRTKAPLLWDQKGYRGGIVLPEEELNLRYVAVTRAQGSCRSRQWGSPLFKDLEDFCLSYPRLVLVDRHSALKPSNANGSGGAVEEDRENWADGPAEKQNEESQQGTASAQAPWETDQEDEGGAQSAEPQHPSQEVDQQDLQATPASETELRSSHRWFLGSLEPAHLRIVTAHYQRKHPALSWDQLLLDLAEQRLVTDDPEVAVAEYLRSQQLTSAQSLIACFLMDVGLVVLDEPVVIVTPKDSVPRVCPKGKNEAKSPPLKTPPSEVLHQAPLPAPARRSWARFWPRALA